MRVVHISTFDQVGGAARATIRLHEGLLKAGVDSRVLVRTKVGDQSTVQACSASEPFGGSFWRTVQKHYVEAHRTPVSNSLFTCGYLGYDLSREPEVLRADILHLHWIWQFQSPTSLRRLFSLGKPIVWTFHDQRAFTGGCHFTAGCDGFTQDCEACPQLSRDPVGLPARNLRDQRNLWPHRMITVVAPSQWMAQEAKRSSLFADSRVEVIPYGIEVDQFRPLPKTEARRQLGVEPDCFCFLFGAESGAESRKGSGPLSEALARFLANVPSSTKVRLLAFGASSPEFERLGASYQPLGYLRGVEALRVAYSAADVFTLPSLQDTYPNTMLEALACGRPVLAFEGTGGVAETVLKPGAGWAVPTGDIAALAAKMGWLVSHLDECTAAGIRGRQHMENNHTLRVQAERYRHLYTELLHTETPHLPGGTHGRVGAHMRAALPRLLFESLRSVLRLG